MNKSKGFTILEMVAAMTVLALVLVLANGFLQFQTKQGRGSSVRKMAHEAATVALMTLRRDLMHAGLALQGNRSLALLAKDQATGSGTPDELYVSFGGYLSMYLNPENQNSFWVPFLSNNSYFEVSGASEVILENVGGWIDEKAVKCVIIQDTTGALTTQDVTVSGSVNTDTNVGNLTLSLGSTVTGQLSPAISYKLQLTGAGSYNPGTLLRNDQPIAGGGLSTADMKQQLKVTDFQIRAHYSDGTIWPDDAGGGAFGTGTFPTDNLRLVEVQVRFLIRDPGGGYEFPDDVTNAGFRIVGDTGPASKGPWTPAGPFTFTVCPRNIVMSSYLTNND
jgi:prepilin-type N-terminal cleavage/methylation domain-containing protein